MGEQRQQPMYSIFISIVFATTVLFVCNMTLFTAAATASSLATNVTNSGSDDTTTAYDATTAYWIHHHNDTSANRTKGHLNLHKTNELPTWRLNNWRPSMQPDNALCSEKCKTVDDKNSSTTSAAPAASANIRSTSFINLATTTATAMSSRNFSLTKLIDLCGNQSDSVQLIDINQTNVRWPTTNTANEASSVMGDNVTSGFNDSSTSNATTKHLLANVNNSSGSMLGYYGQTVLHTPLIDPGSDGGGSVKSTPNVIFKWTKSSGNWTLVNQRTNQSFARQQDDSLSAPAIQTPLVQALIGGTQTAPTVGGAKLASEDSVHSNYYYLSRENDPNTLLSRYPSLRLPPPPPEFADDFDEGRLSSF